MTGEDESGDGPRFICDAMCGGLARWLRALGWDCVYVPGIADGELVDRAQREVRLVLSSDTRLVQRRLVAAGPVRALLLPHGLKLMDQVRFVVTRLRLGCRQPRCMKCNGLLDAATRAEVADRVPARSLLWASEFFVCRGCGNVFWNGSHWGRIQQVRRRAAEWIIETGALPHP